MIFLTPMMSSSSLDLISTEETTLTIDERLYGEYEKFGYDMKKQSEYGQSQNIPFNDSDDR